MNDPHAFDEIPVLTEVVADRTPDAADGVATVAPPADTAVSHPDAAAATTVAVTATPGSGTEATPAPEQRALDDDAWRMLEERLIARVLDRLQDRIELVLEDQLRIGMAPVLDHVVARLAVELHSGLQQTVEQVVTRAVAQELEHLKRRN